MLRIVKKQMRVSPRDDGGGPSRYGGALQVIDGATKLAGLVHGVYQAGKTVAPYIAPYIRPIAAAALAA